jgi:hypothetical protein
MNAKVPQRTDYETADWKWIESWQQTPIQRKRAKTKDILKPVIFAKSSADAYQHDRDDRVRVVLSCYREGKSKKRCYCPKVHYTCHHCDRYACYFHSTTNDEGEHTCNECA